MKIILFQDNCLETIDRYIDKYEEYFFNLFTNTGIFNEETIRENYVREAKNRRNSIIDLIIKTLSTDLVFGRTLDNTIFISWKSKILFIAWEDRWNKRILTDLIIYDN